MAVVAVVAVVAAAAVAVAVAVADQWRELLPTAAKQTSSNPPKAML